MSHTNSLIQTAQDAQNLALLLKLKTEHKCCWQRRLRNKAEYAYLLDWLNQKTPLLQGIPIITSTGTQYSEITKLYWVMNGLIEFPLCPICHKVKLEKNIDSFERGYFRACSPKCASSSAERQQKIEAVMLEKYGSKNFFSSDAGKKCKEDWCKANGVENVFQLASVKAKSMLTRKAHFGYEFTMQSPDKRKLASDNYKTKTGFNHQFSDPKVIAKSNATKQMHIDAGVDLYANAKARNRKRRYAKMTANQEVVPNFPEAAFLALDATTQYTTLLSWHCKKCNSDFDAYLDQNFSSREDLPARCEQCHPYSIGDGFSAAEEEIAAFLKNLVGSSEISQNTKRIISPFELDIWLPAYKLAIEYDGLFWHAENDVNIGKTYHLMKTDLCEKQDIQLIHIFEDEWLEKRSIVESRLKNLLGIYDKAVFARKCEVREVTPCESIGFQEENHIQGAVGAKVHLGLYCGNELISLMTFGKPRFNDNYEWELLRFCNKLGHHVPGGAGKLLRHFERNYKPKSLISYADRRWSQGKLYEALSFKLDHISGPDYWYTKGQKRFSRVKFQKHKLKALLPVYDDSLSEVENMKNNKYLRIYDCGNLVYVKDYS